MYIPFLSQEDLILDNNRQIIPGAKIEVYDPISNNYVDIYTYDGSNERYTVATNPVYLNLQARPEHTYFAKQIVLCRLYKYIGNFSDPRVDDDTQNWLFIREWNGSFTEDIVKNDTIVFGLDGLKSANTELGSINVVGYWNSTDCEGRTYVWDENCTQTPDNGYIVKSNDKDIGRWILKFDGEYLPSTYYGVYPGSEANINALLTYVDAVGTVSIKTAPGVYFVRGDYKASSVALATAKKLLIDNNSSFTRSSITSSSDIKVIGGETNHFITDLYGVKSAHSSWYKSLQGFLDSGAKELIFDKSNNFTQASVMTKNTTLSNVHLVNNTNMYAGWIGFGTYTLTLDRCTVDEHLFYPSTSRIYFKNMLVTDRYFYLPTIQNMDISHIDCDDVNLNLCNFDNAAIYLKWKYQKGHSDIDMEGRIVSDIDFAPSLTGLHNCLFNTLTLNDSNKSVFLENCQGKLSSVNSANLNIYNCRLTIDTNTVDTNLSLSSGGILHINESVITGTGDIQAGADFALLIEHSTVEPTITCPNITNTNAQPYHVIVKFSTISDIEVKNLEMTNSKAGTIKIYGAMGEAGLIGHVTLENNVIDDFGFFTITNFENIVNNCTFVQIRIINNTFNKSFTCPFYVTDSEGKKYEFISSTSAHNWLYKGNNGQCPIDSTQLVTTLPYTDGLHIDSDDHAWSLELTHTFRLFLPGEILVKGTSLGAKMVEFFTPYGPGTTVLHPLNYGLFHTGYQDASDNDYFHMALATDYPAQGNYVITQINMNGV
ncbi:hypothetical protein [Sinorhizobium sp. GL28]|uniref:hypothetical protein n=1 Tax=Sinorhizobium sp. GL28 TaxID=1358418 RepID=UPI000A73F4B8|nr:hypothetical protein [Sinorhizobium sp. GL28]